MKKNQKTVDYYKFLPSLTKQFEPDFMRSVKTPPVASRLRVRLGKGDNLVIFLASSGVGRDTVLENCLKLFPHSERIRRTTTRRRRSFLPESTRMIFIETKNFLSDLKKGKMIFASRYKVNNRLYGISRDELLKLRNRGRTYFFECTLLSLALKKILPKAKLVLLVPPSFNFLEERMAARGDKDWKWRFKNSHSEIKKFLANAEAMFKADYVDLAFINSNSKLTAHKIIKALKDKRYAEKTQKDFFNRIKHYGKR